MQGAANVGETYLSFAIGDEVESEDVLQMDPGRGELDFKKEYSDSELPKEGW